MVPIKDRTVKNVTITQQGTKNGFLPGVKSSPSPVAVVFITRGHFFNISNVAYMLLTYTIYQVPKGKRYKVN